VNLSETADLLTAMSAYDRRTIGDGDVIAWQAVLSDAAFGDCLEAVKQHYAEHTEWVMPAHIRRAVREIVQKREAAASATPWAPGQHGVLKADAMPIELRPSAAEAGLEIKRLALSDLPAEVAALVARVRADLPEGSREALAPRTVAWERENQAYLRQSHGEPNPRYRARAAAEPETVQCPLCTARSQDLPAHMADYHLDDRCCSDPSCRCDPGECACA